MNILDIAIAKKLAGGGGGSGTDNYNDLSNLPKINDTTLSGNKSSSALGLQSEINSDSKLASDLVDDTNQDNKFVTSTEKNTWNGKQNAIDADHKINADYVDDSTSTNKFVTASDKETWNAKQNAIDNSHKLSSDLVDDTNHTNKFVTSTEKNTWNAKQNAIDADHKLSSSLVSFSTAEAAALASGIDSTKVGQISTNQTNILYTLNRTGKNLLRELPTQTINGVTLTNNGDGTYTITRTATSTSLASFIFGNNDNGRLTGCKMTGGASGYGLKSRAADGAQIDVSTDWTTAVTISATAVGNISVNVDSNENPQNVQIRPFVCDAEMYAKDPSFTMPALPNYDLTRLQSEDRASLAEVVDSGAKNLFDWASTIVSNNNATGTKTNTSLTVASATSIYGNCSFGLPKLEKAVRVVFSFSVSAVTTASGSRTLVQVYDNGGASGLPVVDVRITGTGKYELEWNAAANTSYYIFTYPSRDAVQSGNTITITDLMLCTKAAFGASQKFVAFGNDPFYQVPINHNMIYRGRNLGATLTDAQHTALSSGNFTDLYLGDYWTKTVTIPAGTYTGGDGEEVTVPAQTNITLKAVIADFDTFYAGYASSYASINTHHAAVIVTGFSNVVWNKTNSTAGGYVASLIHKWLVGSALPQIETWFGSAKVLSHQKLLTNAITGDAASGWAWSSQKIALLSENQMYGSKVWGNSKAANGGYEPGEAFKHLNVFNHIDANLLFGNKNIWLRDIASAERAAYLNISGRAYCYDASSTGVTPAALILLS